ncbi:alpha/beta fold hydrolase [Thermocatellispora tengchongensis]|uniref:alpha/beta fold hydrolase n=1 Tax=Thermocatellispora tengchongensis TaxID=1073253 RepID=UPI00363340E8
MTRVVVARDGRNLAVETWGQPDATPVFLLHGTPGGRFQPRPRAKTLHLLGIRLISFDRPGYGGSDRRINRVVADAAEDVEDIADALGLGRFAVVGRSGAPRMRWRARRCSVTGRSGRPRWWGSRRVSPKGSTGSTA